MAATGAFKERIQLLQAAQARAAATGKTLKPEVQAELDFYEKKGLLGSTAAGSAGGKVTGEERKAAFLATNLAGALQDIAANPNDAAPEIIPSLLGGTKTTAGNFATGSGRQRVENAQLVLLDSALTLGTGAAYNKEQLEGYRQAYFPQLGDSDETVKDKQRRLQLVLQSARIGAGGAAPQIDAALKAAGFQIPNQAEGGDPQSGAAGVATDGSGAPPAGPATPAAPQNRDAGGTLTFNDQLPQTQAAAMKLTDDQFATFQEAAMRGASVDELKGIVTAFGRPPDETGLQNLQGIAAYYSKEENRKTPLGISYQRDELKPVDPGDGATGAAARGAGNVLTSGLLDEAGALADTVVDGGTYSDNLDNRRGQELFDEQNHGIARGVGQLVGGIPLGGIEFAGAKTAAAAAGKAALRQKLGRDAAMSAANRAYAGRVAVESAAISGAYGAGNANGGAADRVGSGALAGLVGAAGGYGLSRGGQRIAAAMEARGLGSAAAKPLSDGQETLAAMERQGVTPLPADVGGPVVRRATSAAAQTIGGVGPLKSASQATLDSAQAVRDRVATSIGAVNSPMQAGEIARAGADKYIKQSSSRIGRMYDIAEKSAGQSKVETPEALRVLNQELPALEEAASPGPGTAILQGLRDSLGEARTVRGLRNTRSTIREEFESAGLRGSNAERIAKRVIDATTDDIVNGLRAQGQDRAASLYREADRQWAERIAKIDDVLEPVLGRNSEASGEQIVKNLKTAMAGNNRRFVGFIDTLPPEEQGIVRASLISRMGQATKGQQDDTGELFSLPTFLTHWNDIGETAKNRLFGDEGRAALNDLAKIAAGTKGAQQYANSSNTGGALGGILTGGSLAGGPALTLQFLAVQYGAGKLLASPKFARWLARPPKVQTPAAQQAYLAKLTRIARSEPGIANEVLNLQGRLAEAFGGSVTRLAADERNDKRAPVQGNAGQQPSTQQGSQP